LDSLRNKILAVVGSWFVILVILTAFWALWGYGGRWAPLAGGEAGEAAGAAEMYSAWPIVAIIGWSLTAVLALIIGGVVYWRYQTVLRMQKVMSGLRVNQLMTKKILSQNERRIRGIMDNAADGIITIGQTGKIESFSRAAERMFGYKVEELTGQNVSILMAPDEAGQHNGHIKNYLRSGKGNFIGNGPREVTGRHKNGSTFSFELSLAEMVLGEDRIFIGTTRDINQHKEAGSDTSERAQLLNIVIENLDQGIAVMDPDRKLVAFNRHFAELGEVGEGSLSLGMDGTRPHPRKRDPQGIPSFRRQAAHRRHFSNARRRYHREPH
jgi:PAS domain S-box-containing protein